METRIDSVLLKGAITKSRDMSGKEKNKVSQYKYLKEALVHFVDRRFWRLSKIAKKT